MLMSEQYDLDQLRDMLGVTAKTKRESLKALNQKIRELKQAKQLMEFKVFSEPNKSKKRVRRFCFLAKQESFVFE